MRSTEEEVCQCDGSNQVLAKRVKQSSLGQEGQAIKKSVSVMAAIKSWRGQATKSWQEGQAIKPWPRGSSNQVLAKRVKQSSLGQEGQAIKSWPRGSSNQALAKRVKQSRSLSGVTASKESWPEDWLSKQGVLAGRLAEQARSLGQKIG